MHFGYNLQVIDLTNMIWTTIEEMMPVIHRIVNPMPTILLRPQMAHVRIAMITCSQHVSQPVVLGCF